MKRRKGMLLFVPVVMLATLGGRYTFRRARADAPTGEYTISSDGLTVSDNKTGLRWERNVTNASMKYSWNDALTHCNFLMLAGTAGWRVPTYKELETLVDERHFGPAIDPIAFPSTPALAPGDGVFWSSTPFVKFSQRTQSFAVDFFDGRGQTVTTSNLQFVRCVR